MGSSTRGAVCESGGKMTGETTTAAAEDSFGGPAARSAPGAEGQRAVGASAASALGSTQSYCFTPVVNCGIGEVSAVDAGDRRRIRWAARAMLWQASSLKAVRCCGRLLHNDAVADPDDGQGVLVQRREVDGRIIASFHGLMTCGSVWSCPRCSAVIAHTRAAELGSAVRECYRRGGRVYLLTLTMRHTSRDRLAELWDGLSVGWRSVFGCRTWTGQKARTTVVGDAERFDVAGLTRVVEATYGRPTDGGHGWHLHIHALVFVASSLSVGVVEHLPTWLSASVDRDWLGRTLFTTRIYERWSRGLQKGGFEQPGSVGVDVREISDEGSEYLGSYLSKATYDVAARIGVEVAAGQVTKSARAVRNRTPFEVLAELSDSVDARGFGVRTPRHWSVVSADGGDWAVIDTDTGEVLSVTPPGEWRIWHEWERASKGRRQIFWSRRRRSAATPREHLWNALLDVRGESSSQNDEEVAAAEVAAEVVGEIDRSAWYRVVVWRPTLIVEILEVAECSGSQAISRLLAVHGVGFIERPPPLMEVA